MTGELVIAFCHADPGLVAVRNTDGDQGLAQRLVQFTERVRHDRQIATWTRPPELAG